MSLCPHSIPKSVCPDCRRHDHKEDDVSWLSTGYGQQIAHAIPQIPKELARLNDNVEQLIKLLVVSNNLNNATIKSVDLPEFLKKKER